MRSLASRPHGLAPGPPGLGARRAAAWPHPPRRCRRRRPPDAPSPTPATLPADPDAILERGLDLERAAELVGRHRGLRRRPSSSGPSRTEFSHRLRLCEIALPARPPLPGPELPQRPAPAPAATRRSSSTTRCSSGSRPITSTPVPLEPLIRRGLDNLEVALRDPTFLQAQRRRPGRPSASPGSATRSGSRRDRLDGAPTARRPRGPGRSPPATSPGRRSASAAGRRHPRVHLRRLRRPRRLHELPDARQARRPLRDDRRQLRRPGRRAQASTTEGLRLVGVIRGGPAWEAGLKAGDRISHVGGQSGQGAEPRRGRQPAPGDRGDARSRSPSCTPTASTRTFRLVRRHVEVESVAPGQDRRPAVGRRLRPARPGSRRPRPRSSTGPSPRLQRQGMRYLVLDLRGNPGGLLNVAVEIADRFVDQGVIVSTRGRAPGQSQVYRASGRAALADAAGRPDRPRQRQRQRDPRRGPARTIGRAVVIGERSYGKGSVQSIFALRSAPAGLKLTTAKFVRIGAAANTSWAYEAPRAATAPARWRSSPGPRPTGSRKLDASCTSTPNARVRS